MKPNLFVFYFDCPEDFFSKSLAYVANLVPGVGQRLIEIIAVLAGNKASYFGAFEQCEFVGHEFPDDHASSRPDLKLRCSKGTIYFENKLESPLDLRQIQHHFDFICRQPSCSLVFVSNIYGENVQLRSLGKGYLHPEGRDHYLWIDLLPAFENRHGYDSMASRILTDFAVALRENGMIGRNIKGASGSLYTYNSPAAHVALGQLWDLLKDIGFKLSKKPERETTVRAYPVKYRHYPLLNPRFIPTAAGLDEAWDQECLSLTVLSKGDRTALDSRLCQFTSTPECAFFPDTFDSKSGYHYHGHFIVPVSFIGSATNSEIDFRRLRQPVGKILHFLQAGQRPTR